MAGVTAHAARLHAWLAAENAQAGRDPLPLAAGPICERCWMRRGIVCAVGGTIYGGAYRCGHTVGAR
jgi:hypothetical protein